MLITLFISAVASSLAYVELSYQGREKWVLGWFGLLCVILFFRFYLCQRFSVLDKKLYFSHKYWRNRFYFGVVVTGLMLGCGAAALMPYVTINLQLILHSVLLGMGAGAIAYLSTSLMVYVTYLVVMMLPVTLVLLARQSFEGYILAGLYLFMMVAYAMSVQRMNRLVEDALYYRYDYEDLIDDLQSLLKSVAESNKSLEKKTLTDELTGASNYRAFRIHLEELWDSDDESQTQVSLVKLNIDYFHEYNIHYGYEQGDKQLVEIANLLLAEISDPRHMLARLNGAEFAYILPAVSIEDARLMVLHVIRELEHRAIEHVKSKTDRHLTMSVGLSNQLVKEAPTSRELLESADRALNRAKEKGRNRIEIVEK